MIGSSGRVLIVTGMVHSGTTIVASLLAQHPQVSALTSGRWAWLYETLALCGAHPEETQRLERTLEATEGRVLLKAVWPEITPAWIVEHLPEARVVYCQKPFAQMRASWRKRTSLAGMEDWSEAALRRVYAQGMAEADAFARRCVHFTRFENAALVKAPQAALAALMSALGLGEVALDVSLVSADKNIREILGGTELWMSTHKTQS